MQEKKYPKLGDGLYFVSGIQIVCQVSLWEECKRIGVGWGGRKSIWDGISGAMDRAGIGQGWLGGVRTVYHELKMDMEGRFSRDH